MPTPESIVAAFVVAFALVLGYYLAERMVGR